MIRIPGDRFCDQREFLIVGRSKSVLWRIDLSKGELVGGDSEEQPEMFAQRQRQPDFAQEGFAQLRRRQKLYSDQRFILREQLASEEISLTARGSYNCGRLSITQRNFVDCLKPWADDILPGRLRRSADVQRHAGR